MPPFRLTRMLVCSICAGALFPLPALVLAFAWPSLVPGLDPAVRASAWATFGALAGAAAYLCLCVSVMLARRTRSPGVFLAALAALLSAGPLALALFALGLVRGIGVGEALALVWGTGFVLSTVILSVLEGRPVFRPRAVWAALSAGVPLRRRPGARVRAGTAARVPDLRSRVRERRAFFFPARFEDDTGPEPEGGRPEPDATPALSGRLRSMPPGLEGRVLALCSEDHYVRVYVSDGSGTVLRRLSDTIRELGPGCGLQVHRRWWVATGAVDAVIREERSVALRLGNGLVVPVSRARQKEVEEAGWLLSPTATPDSVGEGPAGG